MMVISFLIVVAALVMVIHHLGQLVSLALAALELRRQRERSRPLLREAAAGAGALPGVSAVLVSDAEAADVIASLQRLFEQRLVELEVIVVLDSATGTALDALSERFDLRPADPRPRGGVPTEHVRAVFAPRGDARLLVVDKRGGDRADGWNAGLNLATCPLVVPIDAQTVLDPSALADAALPFALDATTVAVSVPLHHGGVDGKQDEAGLAPGLSQLQQTRRALGDLGLSRFNAFGCLAPAVTLYARHALVRAGGFQPRSPDPTREMALRLHASLREAGTPYRIVQAVDASAHKTGPTKLAELRASEARHVATSRLLLRLYGHTIGDRRFGAVSAVALPYAALEPAAAIVEALGWLLVIVGLALGAAPAWIVLLFVSATLGLGLAVSLAALLVQMGGNDRKQDTGQTPRRVGLSVLEQLGPRQLALWQRVRGWFVPA